MAYLKAIIVTSYCLHFAYSNWAFQSGQPTVQQPHSFQTPFNPCSNSFSPFTNCVADTPSAPGLSWQFIKAKSGIPTWIITTTEIETRNETVQPVIKEGDDPDSPVGPNLREDAMMVSSNGGGEDGEDSDVEFPVRHGKEPAVRARPAFADPDKYEETTTPVPSIDGNARMNQTKTVTVNRTTVVKIEFVNTPFLPLVLRLDSSQRSGQGNNSSNSTSGASQQQTGNPSSSTGAYTVDSSPNSNQGGYRANQNGRPNDQGQNTGEQWSNVNQDGGPSTREQSTTQSFQVVQDSASQSSNGPQPIPGTPISYQQYLQPLPPATLPPQQAYYPQYVNYWKRR